DADGVVTRLNVTIAGRTTPGATVRLDRGSDGSFEQVTTSDASGSYAFALAVDPGTTPVRVEATDACGQRTIAQRTVTRIDAPAVTPPPSSPAVQAVPVSTDAPPGR